MGSWISQFLFPERCSACRTPGAALCALCISRIKPAPPLPPHQYAVFDYGNRSVQRAIWELKYYRHSELARVLARSAATHIRTLLADIERPILVPIPGSTNKVRIRGYNQSVLIATWWRRHIPGACVCTLLHKQRFTTPQARCTRRERLTNVAGSMVCDRVLDAARTYVLIDDVITTGATITEAVRALSERGARRIIAIALAHGYKK